MSCNCPTPNACPTTQSCLCGLNIDIYLNNVLLESSVAIGYTSVPDIYFLNTQSTVWNSILGDPYELIYAYNSVKGRWEMSYFDSTYDEYIIIGVYYTDNDQCPVTNCDWDLDCISFVFVARGVPYIVTWDGEYLNGRKLYRATFSLSGTAYDWEFYFNDTLNRWEVKRTQVSNPLIIQISHSAGPFDCIGNVPVWYDEEGSPNDYSNEPLGVTGYDMKVSAIECGCCDETILIDLIFNGDSYTDVVATIVKDEYGNTLALNGKPYYQFEILLGPSEASFYVYYDGTKWLIGEEIGEFYYTELRTNNDCPFGFWTLLGESNITSIWVRGSECFDCCNYYTPRFSNFIKKKKYDLVDDISAIKNKEIFGMKCGPDWSDLFKKHLILDVLHCLPYGVLCDDEEQCLINSVNENCNC